MKPVANTVGISLELGRLRIEMRHGLLGRHAEGELRGRARLQRILHDASLISFSMQIAGGDVIEAYVVEAEDRFAALDALLDLLADLGERIGQSPLAKAMPRLPPSSVSQAAPVAAMIAWPR